MATILRIDASSEAAKKFLEYAKTLSFAKVEESESTYNPVFVAKILKSRKSKNRHTISTDKLWESI